MPSQKKDTLAVLPAYAPDVYSLSRPDGTRCVQPDYTNEKLSIDLRPGMSVEIKNRHCQLLKNVSGSKWLVEWTDESCEEISCDDIRRAKITNWLTGVTLDIAFDEDRVYLQLMYNSGPICRISNIKRDTFGKRYAAKLAKCGFIHDFSYDDDGSYYVAIFHILFNRCQVEWQHFTSTGCLKSVRFCDPKKDKYGENHYFTNNGKDVYCIDYKKDHPKFGTTHYIVDKMSRSSVKSIPRKDKTYIWMTHEDYSAGHTYKVLHTNGEVKWFKEHTHVQIMYITPHPLAGESRYFDSCGRMTHIQLKDGTRLVNMQGHSVTFASNGEIANLRLPDGTQYKKHKRKFVEVCSIEE